MVAAVALPGAQAQPQGFPGQNGKIVYVARSSSIVVSTPEGTRRTAVATGDHPAWAPDGKRIAYDSYEGISIATLRGFRVVADRVVIRNGRAVEAQQPAWAPDGQRLAYVQGPKSALDGRNVFVADLRSGTRRRITRSARGYDNLQPAWSPDGRWIAFAGCNPRGRCRIMIIRADGSGRRALTRRTEDTENPTWSPDAKLIAFDSCPRCRIHVIRRDGTGQRTLGSGWNPAWSPDGTKLAHEDDDGSGDYECWPTIWVMHLTGGSRTRVTSGCSFAQAPDWQPQPPRRWLRHGEESSMSRPAA